MRSILRIPSICHFFIPLLVHAWIRTAKCAQMAPVHMRTVVPATKRQEQYATVDQAPVYVYRVNPITDTSLSSNGYEIISGIHVTYLYGIAINTFYPTTLPHPFCRTNNVPGKRLFNINLTFQHIAWPSRRIWFSRRHSARCQIPFSKSSWGLNFCL